ncbi:low complexity HA-like repeat protein [Brazilian marseillevirus]|uniref:low complexity HA-like repeat protein n=1 Tax=Brazilian marseillevirus TaxID=1813599 RepID=UPI000784207E|nr:low complexity HA-like repeat protein [Brazilian marseillevirus]AMQ10991.1 low complexity HA-like repeat protein [Brazilian marseillevirus]
MTTNFETRRELVVSKKLVIPVVPSLAAASDATPGTVVFDSSSGNMNVATGTAWTLSSLPSATPTTRGTVFGQTETATASPTSLGYQSSAVAGDSSTFIGYQSGLGVDIAAEDCTGVGAGSMSILGVGARCVAVGVNSGRAVGFDNVSVGANSMNGAVGSSNVCIGTSTGTGLTGSRNTVIGVQAADGTTTGPFNDNVIVGYQAGRTGTTASGNIVVGQGANPALGTLTNSISLGRAATCGTSGTNRIALGTSATCTVDNEMTIAPTITQWRSLGLSSAAAANTLQINPATGIITQAASSRRFKENIRDLEVDTRALHELSMKTYNYKKDGEKDHGLIAEEAFEVLPDIVTLDAEGKPHGIKHLTLAMLLLAELQRLEKEVARFK